MVSTRENPRDRPVRGGVGPADCEAGPARAGSGPVAARPYVCYRGGLMRHNQDDDTASSMKRLADHIRPPRRKTVKSMRQPGWTAWLLLLFALLQSALAMAAAPAYRVVALGAGTPIDVNRAGTVVGIEGSSSAPQPWIVAGGVRSPLPLPAGATYAMVTRLSESGVAVGHVSGRPLIWRRGQAGYSVDWLPMADGATVASPTAVIDTASGPRVLLNYGTPGLFSSPTRVQISVPRPFLVSEAGTLVDLSLIYGLSSGTWVEDMTASGRMLTSHGAILEPSGLVTAAPPPRPQAGWQGWSAWRLNESGEIVAVASLATSDGHGELARYSPGAGWFVIETRIGAMYPFGPEGLSEAGDALTAAYGGHMLTTADGQRLALSSLLLDAGWALAGGVGAAMSDDGRVAIVARNPAGTWVAARLDPAGTLPAPPPVQLTGAAHPATYDAPWDAIQLSWTAASGASSYVVERKGPSDPAWVTLTPGTIQLKYDDTAIAALTTYSYRVFAKGVGGLSPASNVVSVLSPPAKDSTPPVAAITSPANGSTVSGPVTVTAQASDNVGLLGMEIRVQPNMGTEVVCSRSYATARASDTLSCTWDPRYLSPGTSAQLSAYAYDGMRNFVINPITVTVAAVTADTRAPVVTVLEPASNSTVSGIVTVRATATDNVGVARMEIRDPRGALLSTSSGGAISGSWNTSGLRRNSKQTLTIRAFDAAGNVGSAKLTVRIGG